MSLQKNTCRVVPAIVARNPFLLEELIMVGRRPTRSRDIPNDVRRIKRIISTRISEELTLRFGE